MQNRLCRAALPWLLACVSVAAQVHANSPPEIGVNYFDCFYRTLVRAHDTSYEAGFAALQAHHITFARFAACGYWPSEMKLYQENKAEYFRRLDGVVDCAARHHVRLIPCFFWTHFTVPDLIGESCDQWSNPASKTRLWAANYVREIVERYRHSPAILGWECANEFNLMADIPSDNPARFPPVQPTLGTPKSRSQRDEMTTPIVVSALQAIAEEIHQADGEHLISSGNAVPRASAWHLLKNRSWETDTPQQQAAMLAMQNPRPCSVISVHVYDHDFARLPALANAAASDGRPLFIGEFGVAGFATDGPAKFDSALKQIIASGTPLASLWVYDMPGQKDDWSVTFVNARAYQLHAIESVNASLQSGQLPATQTAQPAFHEETFVSPFDHTRQTYLIRQWHDAASHDPPVLVLYLHGSGSHQDQGTKSGIYFDNFGRLQRCLAAKGNSVYICPEYRGNSWMGPAAEADIVEIIRIARKKYHPGKVILTGGSMGGTSALIFASRHPDLLDGAVAWCPATDPVAMYSKFADQFRAGYGGSPTDVPAEYAGRTSRDYADALAKIPIAIVHGDADTVIPVEHSRLLVQRLKALHATVKYIELPRAGHDGPFQADVAALMDWVIAPHPASNHVK